MNFLTILKSLDDLLYEVMSWLVFYRLTLWRALTQPLVMMRYADTELKDAPERQYTDVLSPPLFLLLTLLISHMVELAVIGDSPLIASRRGLAVLISDDTSLIALRMVAFATFPLTMAVRMVRAKRQKLERETLKLPFYSQCYAAGPLALMFSVGTTLGCRMRAASAAWWRWRRPAKRWEKCPSSTAARNILPSWWRCAIPSCSASGRRRSSSWWRAIRA